ncbi:MAG: hypothetical protein E6Q51_04275 [Methylophilus methylotrophus]|uniref:Uncharacterized protein n=1 Tax=Methylophilus methylotrophus TaxID=17 RepID=A0A5C7WJZ1_METME|nr:MAG: hypothetical protein E6Q51_04275 [Methylophilus methylotrophus]
MVQKATNRLQGSRELTPLSNPQAARVVASPVSTYVAPAETQLGQLVGALSQVQPSLSRYLQVEDAKQEQAGKTDAQLGKEQESDSQAYVRGYSNIKGNNQAITDLEELQKHLETNYNPDTDDYDTTVKEWLKTKTEGVTDRNFLDGYAPVMDNALNKLKQTYATQRLNNIKDATNSEAMKMISTGMEQFANRGEPVPDTWINSTREFAAEHFKMSNTEFNELQFLAAKKLGDAGNFNIYEQFKRPRLDGTPGMYFIPKWKERIDAAEFASKQHFVTLTKQAETQAKANREKRQDEVLADIFTTALTGDFGTAMSKFKDTIKNSPGLFGAADVSEWTGKFQSLAKASAIEETEEQKVNATLLLAGIYEGRKGIKDVLQASTSGQVSYSQGRQLLDSVNSFNSANRAADAAERAARAAEVKKGNEVYDSMEYKAGKEYITNMLRTQPTVLDPTGEGMRAERQQQAEAILEFTQRSANTPKSDLPKLRDEIADRYLKRRAEASSAALEAFSGRIRYSNPSEAAKAYSRGDMTDEQLAVHYAYFKLLHQRKMQQEALKTKSKK